ncbi:MAG: thermonuclease family protein [Desulfobulbaceae bacterium]
MLGVTPREAAAWEGTVAGVIDGDSIKVRRDSRLYEIRLYGIDTPEYRQPYSNKAKQLTRRLCLGRASVVLEKDIDRYGRIVAVVFCGDTMVNRELVEQGLAWHYPRYCHEQPLCGELRRLEERAAARKRGLWRDPSPVAPWEWKRRQRRHDSESGSRWHERFLDWLR